jgi:electron transfer flavoprotein alpha subunit
LAAEANRYPLNLQVILERDIEKFDVTGKTRITNERKKRISDVTAKSLDSALRIEEPTSDEDSNEEGKDLCDNTADRRELLAVLRTRKCTITDYKVQVASKYQVGYVSDCIELVRHVTIGKDPAPSRGGVHAGTDGAKFPKVAWKP